MSPSHQERCWALLCLQTAEILSQLQDYYLVVVAGEHCGSVFMPARPPCWKRKNESKACGGEVDSTHAHLPLRLNNSSQLTDIGQDPRPFSKRSRITTGNGPLGADRLLVSYPSLIHMSCCHIMPAPDVQ